MTSAEAVLDDCVYLLRWRIGNELFMGVLAGSAVPVWYGHILRPWVESVPLTLPNSGPLAGVLQSVLALPDWLYDVLHGWVLPTGSQVFGGPYIHRCIAEIFAGLPVDIHGALEAAYAMGGIGASRELFHPYVRPLVEGDMVQSSDL